MSESYYTKRSVQQILQNRSYFASGKTFDDLTINMFTFSDISLDYVSWLNDSRHMQFSDQQFKVHDLESSRRYVQSFEDTPNLFLKAVNSAGSMVATLTLYIDPEHRVHNCGILVNPKETRRGYGRKAWAALTMEISPDLGARKIVAGCVESNQPMIRLFELSKMDFGARLRAEKEYSGKSEDILIYSRLVFKI